MLRFSVSPWLVFSVFSFLNRNTESSRVSLLVALFNFQGAVYIRRGISLRFGAFFFSEVFVVSLRDSLFIIAHFLSFVNPFSKIFSSFFQEVFIEQAFDLFFRTSFLHPEVISFLFWRSFVLFEPIFRSFLLNRFLYCFVSLTPAMLPLAV